MIDLNQLEKDIRSKKEQDEIAAKAKAAREKAKYDESMNKILSLGEELQNMIAAAQMLHENGYEVCWGFGNSDYRKDKCYADGISHKLGFVNNSYSRIAIFDEPCSIHWNGIEPPYVTRKYVTEPLPLNQQQCDEFLYRWDFFKKAFYDRVEELMNG